MGLHADRNDQQATTYAVAERLSKNITLFLMCRRENSTPRQIDLLQRDQLGNFSCADLQKSLGQDHSAKQSRRPVIRQLVAKSTSE